MNAITNVTKVKQPWILIANYEKMLNQEYINEHEG